MFQETRRRNEAMKLQRETGDEMKGFRLTAVQWRHLPLVKRWESFFLQHGQGAVHGAAVLPRHRVHEASFHHVHRRRDHGGAEPSGEGCGEVTRHVVCGGNNTLNLNKQTGEGSAGGVHLPVISWFFRMSSLMTSYVTSSEQFTMELRATFSWQPVNKQWKPPWKKQFDSQINQLQNWHKLVCNLFLVKYIMWTNLGHFLCVYKQFTSTPVILNRLKFYKKCRWQIKYWFG